MPCLASGTQIRYKVRTQTLIWPVSGSSRRIGDFQNLLSFTDIPCTVSHTPPYPPSHLFPSQFRPTLNPRTSLTRSSLSHQSHCMVKPPTSVFLYLISNIFHPTYIRICVFLLPASFVSYLMKSSNL